MRHLQPLHRVTIGRTREVRGPDALERGFVGLVIVAAMAFAVWFGVQQMHMTEAVEAVSLGSAAVGQEVVHYSVHGTWPAPGDSTIMAGNDKGNYVKGARLGPDGRITMQMRLGPIHADDFASGLGRRAVVTGALTLRPQLLGAPGSEAVVVWCGYAGPAGRTATLDVANKTTLPRRDLPPFCR
jgi:hypothetical protein